MPCSMLSLAAEQPSSPQSVPADGVMAWSLNRATSTPWFAVGKCSPATMPFTRSPDGDLMIWRMKYEDGMTSEQKRGYAVGYGRPPRATQFQKGRSGNAKGRPKRSKSFIALFVEDLNDRILVN